MDQGDVILAGGSEVERQVDEIERLGRVEQSTNEEELQNKEETGYEMFSLAETSANARQSAGWLTSVSAARGKQRLGRKEKGKGG